MARKSAIFAKTPFILLEALSFLCESNFANLGLEHSWAGISPQRTRRSQRQKAISFLALLAVKRIFSAAGVLTGGLSYPTDIRR
jgi:hypothetical protein